MGTYNQDWLDAEWELMDKTRDLKAERDALAAELAVIRSSRPPEPFGYFRCNSFGWEDCHDDDEGAIALYEHPLLTDAELKLIMNMRKIKENHGKQLIGIDLADGKDKTIFTVFAAPKEDFKDWPEDRGEFPQKGLGQL